jgi:hypothetical protein
VASIQRGVINFFQGVPVNKIPAIVCACLAVACIQIGKSNAAECPVGSRQTLNGSMSEAVDSGDGNWLSMIVENAQPCTVTMVKGKGKVPAGCGFGEYFGRKKFTATGVVSDGAVLEVTSIRCS